MGQGGKEGAWLASGGEGKGVARLKVEWGLMRVRRGGTLFLEVERVVTRNVYVMDWRSFGKLKHVQCMSILLCPGGGCAVQV